MIGSHGQIWRKLLVVFVAFFGLSACSGSATPRPAGDGPSDFVIVSGGGYSIHGQITGDIDMVGVQDSSGKWLYPLSSTSFLIQDGHIRRTQDTVVTGIGGGLGDNGNVPVEAYEQVRISDIQASYEYVSGSTFACVVRTEELCQSFTCPETIRQTCLFDAATNEGHEIN